MNTQLMDINNAKLKGNYHYIKYTNNEKGKISTFGQFFILDHWGRMSEREAASKMLDSLGFTLKNERVHYAKGDTELFLAYADGNNVIIDITEQLSIIKRTITKQGLKVREVSQTSIADNISYLVPTESVVSNLQNLVREFKSLKNIRELSVVRARKVIHILF